MSVELGTGREPPDLVRVSVVAGSRRSDLALPAYLPVAELLPGVARSLPVARAPDGFVLVAEAGPLDPVRGLAEQEVVDGAVLRLVRIDPPGAAVHDDPAEAVAGAVDELFSRWRSTDGRRATTTAAVVLTGPAAALAVPVAVSGLGHLLPFAALTLGLAAAGVALANRRSGRWLPVGLVAFAAGYAAASAVAVAEPAAPASLVIAGGAAVLAVGIVGVLVLRQGAGLVVGLVVAGAVLLAAGALMNSTGVGFASLALAVVPGLLVADAAAPRLVLAMAAPSLVDRARDDTGDEVEGEKPVGLLDLDAVRADVALAHDVLLGLTLGAGVLLWLAVPLLTLHGPAGVALAAVACLVVLLRSRHHVVVGQVIARLAVGAVGLVVLLSLWCWRQPDVAGGWLSLLLPLMAGAVVAAGRPTPWRWRLADVIEGLGVAAVLPLLALAAGVTDLVPRWLP